MSHWFHDGKPASVVPLDDRAFQYGDGLFETIAIRNGEPRLWRYHMDRLAAGCERLRIAVPDAQPLRKQLGVAVTESGEIPGYCAAKIIVSCGVSARGYARENPTAANTYIGIFATRPVAAELYRDGVETRVCETKLALFSATAGLKTLNRLEQVLARSECHAHGAFEGLTLDAGDQLICGTMSNVFIVSNEAISTPSLHRCGVEGVMRRHTIDTLAANDITVECRDIGKDELFQSDEVFLTNSQFGVLPVRRCGDKVWRQHPVTQKVMAMMARNGVVECVA
ncbi:MAG: aminodeoxychorismate lyase [Gammaproteobacteria bacterium]|nr:aminodeoxychorismate lyase [Gammaproteobacteria bacterium]MDH3364286.1 aminodeoxychorismate lyase [Gammaproteobacteria bacterium]MDH3481094.1 aminodeoxychorismate lyase [Gammaproteobacteria bacterium]